MEVILKEDVPKLGRRGEVVKVADGYGRNFLLPRRLAIEANEANRRNIEQMRAAARRKEARDLESARGLADTLKGVALVFRRRAGEHDTLFGSVTSMDVAEELARQGYDVDRRRIELPEPLKQIGTYHVPLSLFRGVTADLKIEIVREQEQEQA
jgi:large subunit ribosomal protein L9